MTSGSVTDDNAEAALDVARRYIDVGNYGRAADLLRTALSQHPDDAALLAQYARAELLLDNYDAAAHSAYAALSRCPHDAFAMQIYALALEGQGRLPEALFMASRTVADHPHDAYAHIVYARMLCTARQLNYALVAVNEALRLEPTYVPALVLRGYILHGLGQLRESTAAYRQALSLEPGNAEALHNIAVNKLSRGKFGRALRGFLGAAALDPAMGDLARRNIGAALAKIFKRITVLAVFLGIPVAMVGEMHSTGESTAGPRLVAGLVTTALIVSLGWVLRVIPRRVLVSVLRQRAFVAARLVHALLGVGAGAWATIIGGSAWMIVAGVALVVSGLLLVRIGWMIGA
ncbi:beta-barrel assembly-enhancing protease [Mycobacterium heckeshornense]|uniref:tetratricopeptide repeat protein n=1 Tax=Mycobacterium heckeshornense TaxID=110505 RepID=UPI0019428389|nr:tetratricopeptide repeat protein [Mycobacterium heckeshornense]BCQ10551.1 beta-barrel assembly-enhancing protease [Mycobacterium heckeshornense]